MSGLDSLDSLKESVTASSVNDDLIDAVTFQSLSFPIYEITISTYCLLVTLRLEGQ